MKRKWIIGGALLYALFSAGIISLAVTSYHMPDRPRLFFQDPALHEHIETALASDHNMVFIARLLHNKLLVSWQVFCDSVYRAFDLSSLFSLTQRASMYADMDRMPMLPPWELPFFLIAVSMFVRRWEQMKRYKGVLLLCFAFSVLSAGFFWPSLFPLKLIPLMVTIQLVIFLGCMKLLEEVLWSKK